MGGDDLRMPWQHPDFQWRESYVLQFQIGKKIDINGARPSKCSTLFFSVAKNSPRRSSSRSLRGFR